MSNQASSASAAVVFEPKPVSFLEEGIELKALLRRLGKQQKVAVERLVQLCSSTDETLALRAATKLMELYVQVAKEVNDDALKRLIAEVRLNPSGAKQLLPVDENKRPEVRFDQVIEIN